MVETDKETKKINRKQIGLRPKPSSRAKSPIGRNDKRISFIRPKLGDNPVQVDLCSYPTLEVVVQVGDQRKLHLIGDDQR